MQVLVWVDPGGHVDLRAAADVRFDPPLMCDWLRANLFAKS